ncbi:MAG: type I secretion system permease/ATPase [Desulfamplus sp.]|nr:type I secretion system permease/ATPase [Desulfamplus sp.]
MNSFLKKWNRYFTFVALISIFINLAQLASPLYMFTIFGDILVSYSKKSLMSITVAAFFAVIFFFALHYLRKRILVSAGRDLNLHMRTTAFENMIHGYALQADDSYTQGLNDLEILKSFFTSPAVTVLFDIPWTPLYLILIFFLNMELGFVTASGLLIMISLNLLKKYIVRESGQQKSMKSSETNRFVNASIQNAEVISAMGMTRTVSALYNQMNRESLFFQTVSNRFAVDLKAVMGFMQSIIQILTYFIGVYLSMMQGLSFGMVIVVSMIMRMVLGPCIQAINMWDMAVNTKLAYNRMHYFMRFSDIKPEQMAMPRPSGNLTVHRASCIAGQNMLLRGVTFKLNHGEFMGIIGPGGAGKSTLCRLILGIWPAYSGKVQLDGMETFQIERENSGKYIGYLPQEVELFPATVAQNIARLGSVDMEKVLIAAQICGLDEMIENMPDGYDTMLEGVDGLKLSGGQKQRLGMARAVYGDPSLIVLDEPTANLDKNGEQQFVETLKRLKLKRDCTCIMVTHKPALLTSMDKVLVMQSGTVALFGNRDAVFKTLHPSNKIDTTSNSAAKEIQG